MLINFNQQFRLRTNELNTTYIILIPIVEIFFLIKIGSQIGALSTILLIFQQQLSEFIMQNMKV